MPFYKTICWGGLILLFTVAGCAPVYIPSARQTHLLNEKGEASAAVYSGTNGTDAQLAYAVSDHFGVIGATSFDWGNGSESDGDYHEHWYGEAGLQYQTALGQVGRFEFMGGAGTGSATSRDVYSFNNTQNEVRATGKFNKLFVQSNIGLESKVIETGLAMRLGHVMYNEFETSRSRYATDLKATFFEPALFARLGWEEVKIEGQIGYSRPLSSENDIGFEYQPFFLTLGAHLNLKAIFDQK